MVGFRVSADERRALDRVSSAMGATPSAALRRLLELAAVGLAEQDEGAHERAAVE